VREWGIDQAQCYEADIIAAAALLCRHPGLGSARFYRGRYYRKWNVGRHQLLYRTSKSAVIIVRVLHGAMAGDSSLG